MKKDFKILYIDDEVQNLNSFKATFRRDFEIFTAINTREAHQILKNHTVQIIITDQKMPEITGIEFFKQIIDIYPDPIRILLTGYTDIDALADAINIGNIYRYITKPWNELELRNAIKNAFDTYYDKVLLKEKVRELEQTNEELNRFIYSISHDLRAPVASIKGILNLINLEGLNDLPENKSYAEYCNMFSSCVEKLDFYIQKTIQYYRANKSVIERKAIDFNQLLNNLITYQIPQKKEVKVSIEIQQTEVFWNDEFLLEVILGNIISNAVDYQRAEELDKYVTIKIVNDFENAFICIEDNGIGIEKEYIDKIFAQFFKGRHHQGTGLGLYIVKQTVQKLKGEIKVTSTVGIGTKIEIRIPNITPECE